MTNVLRKIVLPTILAILAYGFWLSPDFKAIAAGVAIFLFGMLALEEGFRAFTGGSLEQILKRSTNRLWKSLSFGIVTTTIMQSSSLVSVITISFLSAGLIGLSEGLGIVFGANLGTTTGAWLVAGFGLKVNIAAYAMPMLVFGVILIFQSAKKLKGLGYIFAGLGFLFLGIHYMKEGFEAFRETINLAEYAVSGYPGLFLFALIGVAATVIMQSSHATLVIIITALAAQQITYENALALAIGANVGTTITAILGALGSNEKGRQLAGGHLIFNVVTGFVAILFIHQFKSGVDFISAMVGIGESDYTLKLAVFHTLFNLAGILIMVPLIGRLVHFLEKVIRAAPSQFAVPAYLNESALAFADTAIEAVRNETLRVYDNAHEIIARGLSLGRSDMFSEIPIEDVIKRHSRALAFDLDAAYERDIKSLYGAIITFCTRVPVEVQSSHELSRIRTANQNIITVLKGVKHLQKNMNEYINSDNAYIRDEYNRIRSRIIRVIRRLDKIGSGNEPDVAVLSLDALKLTLEENATILNERLERLIRSHHITADMGVSLINDSNYSYEIIRNLISVSSNLFHAGARAETEAEHMIALEDHEISSVLEENAK
ncbi:MAG: sodium:phosphate symporter [Zetaproteobacteria bacterium CG1_02_53_45]|nr:MAG: sodium:phosphate symporter [Zetaproteobacteria bacterium CG1_02_53_45]